MLNYRIIARAFAGLIGLEGLLFMVCSWALVMVNIITALG